MDLSQVSAENITQASGESLVINSKTKKVLQKNQQMDTSSKVMTRKRFQQFVEEDSANRKYARAQAVKVSLIHMHLLNGQLICSIIFFSCKINVVSV